MKNLKKILSLVLALAMALSLMTVAFAKDTGDFADGDDVTYAEAVDVMATVGVFNGVGDGSNFDPKGTLTREQAAKIITYMIMGQAQADKLVATIAPFADVSADRWSAGAIAYCASEGIMNGTGNGKFNPTGELTGLQFAKMLLVALGYDAEIEDMTGAAWGLATSKLAYAVELDDGMDDINLTDVMTREQAAQMALTTMKTPLVEYPDKGATIKVNGAVVEFGAQKAQYVTSEIAREQTISKVQLTNGNGYTVEFGEKYCQKLVLNGGPDVFGAPSYTWTYDKKEINTYEDDSDLVAEFTTKVTGKDLYDAITKNVMDHLNDFDVYIDGETDNKINTAIFGEGAISRTNTEAVGATEKGVLTQVFVTNVDDKGSTVYDVTIVIKNTYLAIATENYDTKNEEVDLEVYALNAASNDSKDAHSYIKDRDNEKKAVTVKADDIDVTEVEEDEIYLVTVADGKVQEMIVPEVISDASIDSFRLNKDVSVDGTTYEYAHTAKYDVDVLNAYDNNNLKDVTYNVILDLYGYLIGIEQNEDPDQFVFITGMDGNNSNLSAKKADMNAIFLDGTMETISVNMGKSTMDLASNYTAYSQINQWYTYGVDSDGVYTLKAVPTALSAKDKYAQYATDVTGTTEVKIDKKNVTLASNGTTGKVYGNDDTVYINVKTKALETNETGSDKWRQVIDEVDSITVGVKNASLVVKNATQKVSSGTAGSDADHATPPTKEVYTLFNDKGYVVAAVTIGEDEGMSKNYAYVTSSSVKRESYDKTTDKWTWTREAVVNGELVDLKEVGSSKDLSYLSPASSDPDHLVQGEWFEIKYDANGNVKKATALKTALTDAGSAHADDGYVNDVADVQAAVTAKDNAILWQTGFTAVDGKDTITYKNGTLYIDTTGVKGFSVSPEVKVVVCTSDGSGKASGYFDDVDDSYKNYDGLDKAIRDLDSNFTGDLSAVFENGVATTIIFNDTTVDSNAGNKPTPPPAGTYSSAIDSTSTITGLSDLALSNAAVDDTTDKLSMPVVLSDNIPTQIKDAMAKLGYTDVTMSLATGTYTIKGTDPNGMARTLTYKPGAQANGYGYGYYKVTVDDTLVEYVKAGSNGVTKSKATATGTNPTGFIKSTDGGTTWAYDAYDGTTTYYVAAGTDDVEIKTDYYSITGVADVEAANKAVISGDAGATTAGKYAIESTVDSKGVKIGDDFAVKADATITIKVTYIDTTISGTTGDSVAVAMTASKGTVTGSPLTFGTTTEANAYKTATITTFTGDDTYTIKGSNS